MKNLKPVYDAAQTAEAEVQQIMTEMLAAFNENTEEGKAKAMALRSALDAAKVKANEANQLYISLRDADANDGGPAAKFVPVPSPEEDAQAKKVITRSKFEALDHLARHKFFEDGGQVVDDNPAE